MLYTVALLLIIAWALGLVTSYTMGGFIHLLLVIAFVVVLIRIIFELFKVDASYKNSNNLYIKGNSMNDKALYIEKIETELKEWKAEIELFKAKSLSATADAKISMNENIKVFEAKVEEAKVKLAELVKSTENTFDAMRKTFEIKWEIIKTAVVDTTKKLNA